jgi:myo-inositol-1(or 4)-monophosphatase
MKSEISLKTICYQAISIVKEAGDFVRQHRGNLSKGEIENKGTNDFVTTIDKASEKMLVAGLRKILPGSGFLTEENTATTNGEKFIWIIDPIDGTTNFIHGLAPFSVSVGLQYDGKLVMGIVYEICHNECFYAWEGSKAYLNESEIKVSDINSLSNSLIITGFPYKYYGKLPGIMKSIEYFIKNTSGLRRLGSAAADLAYVACGRSEGFFEYGLSPWDAAAGTFIVQQAGGKCSDFEGGDNYIFGKQLIASNSKIHQEMLQPIKTLFT